MELEKPPQPTASRMECASSPTRLSAASEREIAVELARLKAIFGFEETAWRIAASAYFEALADIPADLLHDSVRMIIANARAGDRFPRPGDIREHIREPLEVRRRAAGPLALPAPSRASDDMMPEAERITAEQAAAIVLRHGIRKPAAHRPAIEGTVPGPRLTGAQLLARDGFRGVPMGSGFTEGV